MTHDQPARLACRAPTTLRLPCLHQPHTTATYQGDPMSRRPTTAALTYRPDRLDAETLPTVLLDGIAHVPVSAVVSWLDAHAARWDRYAADLKATGKPDPFDLKQAEQRYDDLVGAGAVADELTHRATDLTRLHATAALEQDVPVVDEGVLAMRGLLHGLALSAPVYALGALTAWALTR